ncbi:unnamed protein product [Bursaphelenchus xylophilus]|uniref:(pine wood nematode) hypothetical protein n=1 Tax=Bursaphelenchus xylophilus TaxID=6326 RepID=A0A1I7RNI6_BURXY|nr:unnamed protein product [Bursaphelenchus xylophilus]CAG9124054.1 unnamed protein product [Bursaphelenchus xylophilus]
MFEYDCNDGYGNDLVEYTLFVFAVAANVSSLILFKKLITGENRYGCMLKINCTFMLINTFTKIFTRVHFYTIDGMMFVRIQGPHLKYLLRDAPMILHYAVVVIDKITCYCALFITIIPFVYRYIVITKNRVPTFRDYLLIIVSLLSMSSVLASIPALFSYINRDQIFEVMGIQPNITFLGCVNPPIPYMASMGETMIEHLKGSTLLIVVVSSYMVIYYCTTAVARHIHHSEPVSMRTKCMQERLLYAMRIQAVIPTFFSLIPFLLSEVATLTGFYPNEALFVLYLSLFTLNFINPLLVLITIKESRQILFCCFDRQKKRIHSTQSLYSVSHGSLPWKKITV